MSTKKPETPLYSRDELRRNCPGIFGVQVEVLDGALYGDCRSELSLEEVREMIRKFLRKGIN